MVIGPVVAAAPTLVISRLYCGEAAIADDVAGAADPGTRLVGVAI
jgi:hypothetical protein